jgi:peptidoglycan hydrolase CwlO-like protein
VTRSTLKEKTVVSAVMAAAALLIALTGHAGLAYADLDSDLAEADEAAGAAQETYEAAQAKQEELTGKLDSINKEIGELEEQLPALQAEAGKAVKDMYVNGTPSEMVVEALLNSQSVSEAMDKVTGSLKIAEHQLSKVSKVKDSRDKLADDRTKAEKAKKKADKALKEADEAKIAALDRQEEARAAYDAYIAEQEAAAAAAAQAAASASYSEPSYSAPAASAPTSSSWGDEASAKAYIVGKESGGNYSARNGQYYGAYQLTESYLGGDYSPENQDRVADEYVKGRYGSWSAAASFWDSHNWY